MVELYYSLKEKVKLFVVSIYDFSVLSGRAFKHIFTRPFYGKEIVNQMHHIGVKSLPIVLLTSTFTGMVMALQTGYEIARFGAKIYIGTIISLSMIRELGPVLTGLVISGRVGAGIAAELGSMKVTEQISAMRAMATDPIKKLVSTKLVAGIIMIPALTVISDLTGILGGLFISNTYFGISATFYKVTVFSELVLGDLIMGLAKPLAFALVIILVGCYMGFTTTGGTEGVGKSTTRAVVTSSILILVGDYFITKVLFFLF
ncbi:ABC transporter permease [bacterium]|nr:ABC transporter permease [bacterium]